MMSPPSLAAFAEFVVAQLPRLLLYPGGLFALACAGLLSAILPRVFGTPAAEPPPACTRELEAVLALALAWAGWALLPLPGAPPVPGAPDLLGPLALLLGASLLLYGSVGNPGTAPREARGLPLLLAAPLIALTALGSSGLVPAGQATEGSPLMAAARVLAGLAYVVGFCVCYAGPGAAPWQGTLPIVRRAAAWMSWLGWLGVGASLGPAAWATAGQPAWVGALLVAVLVAAAAGAMSTAAARTIAARGTPAGWAALGLAVLVVLLGR